MTSPTQLEERLRDVLAKWDYVRSPGEVVALGPAALRRLLDAKEGKGSLWSTGVDPRDYMEAEGAAITAFARNDLDGVLTEMRKRGWNGCRIAQSGVGNVSDPRVASALLELYASKSPLDRANAVGQLGMQRDPRATETLVRALSDRSSDVQYTAVRSLGEAGNPSAIEPLKDFAKRTTKDWMAAEARSAIAKIRKAARSRR